MPVTRFWTLLLLSALCLAAQGREDISPYDSIKAATQREYQEFLRQSASDYNSFVNNAQKDYDDFVAKANKDYADFLKQAWEEYNASLPVKAIKEPKPVTPPSLKPATPAPAPSPSPKPTPPPAPQPSKPQPLPFTPGVDQATITYLGNEYKVDGALSSLAPLGNTEENSIAKAYKAISQAPHQQLIQDLKAIQARHGLNDCGMLQLVVSASRSLASDPNMQVVLQSFLLDQLGFLNRMARNSSDKRLFLLFVPDVQIYGRYYSVKDGNSYFTVDDTPIASFYMCGKGNENATRPVSMSLAALPQLGGDSKTVTKSPDNHAFQFTTTVNEKLMDFFNAYPQCDYQVYHKSVPSNELVQAIDAQLQPLIQGKTELEAANLLLNFVQTAFDYETDGEQFGREKTFFPDEVFYYPYCDCEDRAIFFSYLTRHLLNLPTVLIEYPNHIATAVRFSTPINGDNVLVNGTPYMICDPTFIHSRVGQAMPRFRDTSPQLVGM